MTRLGSRLGLWVLGLWVPGLWVGLSLVACGAPPPPTSAPEPEVDRSPATRPAETVLEVSLRGGDVALAALVAALPPTPLRAALPVRIGAAIDGLLETPEPIRSRVSSHSPIHVLMARIDGETRSAVAVELDEAVPAAERRAGGPRGASRVGEHAAVDDLVAVVADDDAMLALSYAYLAYGGTPSAGDVGELAAVVPASTVAGALRSALERIVRDQEALALASIASARGAHDRPPDLGDPEAFVHALSGAALARAAYLPDLGDATLVLTHTPSGLALTMDADVTPASPLARALEERRPVATALVSAAPTSSAIVLAAGSTAASRASEASSPVEVLAAIAGARLEADERTRLEGAASALAALRGEETAWATGATDAGAFGLELTRGGSAAPMPAPWGRSFPWSSQVIEAMGGCAPTAPHPSATGAAICGELALATRAEGDARVDAVGRAATALAEPSLAALVHETEPSSPDLARDLAALPGVFAIALVRPLRVLPWLAAFGGTARTGLPAGDGAIVLGAAASEGHLRVALRASTAALANLDVVQRLFADETDSE